MSEIVLRGSLQALQVQAQAIRRVVRRRVAEGWRAFQSDEVWFYETEMDDRVCPVCEAFGTQHIFMGDTIPITFPDYELTGRQGNWIIYPRVHRIPKFSYLKGDCRCRLIWQNALECLERRLHEEKLRVVT